MTREEADFVGGMNMCDEISNEAYKKIMCHCEEQEPCDDEYIKVPKKALKYRTAGMVAYNVEWLKNHFDLERAVICGAQQPCDDCVRRQEVLDVLKDKWNMFSDANDAMQESIDTIKALKSVTPLPQPFDLEGLKSDLKALNCGFPYGLDYLLDCLKKRLEVTIIEADKEQ